MSDSDSDSDDDIPLSALAKKKENESSEEAEFDEEGEEEEEEEEDEGEEYDESDFIDDDDAEEEEGDDGDGDYESDSSDDIPLSELKSPKDKRAPPKKSKAPAKRAPSKKAAPKRKASSAKKRKSSAKKPASSSSSGNFLCASGELYPLCDKGRLVQSLLARWWYAYEWPDPKVLLQPVPPGHDALDGFPGVFICTRGSDVGKFLDMRDHSRSPSFKNFARKDSEELRDLLLRAIEKQTEALLEREGEGTDAERGLKVLERWATKLNCAKADRQALKVLKAKKLELP